MSAKTIVLFAMGALCLLSTAQAGDPYQYIGRYLGFGWGDGYHSKRTWSLELPAAHEHVPAPPPRKPPQAGPRKPETEPVSPSDMPVLKTSRRYPVQQQQEMKPIHSAPKPVR